MTRQKKFRHILADCDLTFAEKDIQDFIYLWNEGRSLEEIHRYLRKRNCERTYDEICLLLFDLSRTGQVTQREKGIFGEVS